MSNIREYNNTDEGGRWITHSSCGHGDYGGAGSVGLANIRWLQENHPDDVWVRNGAYHSQAAYLPDTEEYRELLQTLDNYPLFDDEQCSRVEMEWEDEAWTSWLRSQLVRTLGDVLETWVDQLPDDDSSVREAYHSAMEAENEYPITEYNGVCVRVERIQDTFGKLVGMLALSDAEWSERSEALAFPPLATCPMVAGILLGDRSEVSYFALLDWIEEQGVDCSGVEWIVWLAEHFERELSVG